MGCGASKIEKRSRIADTKNDLKSLMSTDVTEKGVATPLEGQPENAPQNLETASNTDPSDLICKQLKKGSAKHALLQTATVEMFVKEGKKWIGKINEMPMNLEDMPDNFNSAHRLRQVYFNARYNVDVDFCKDFLDKIMEEGLFTCLKNAMQKLQETWPKLFSETTDSNEEFKNPISKVHLSDFAHPEMTVASVWIKLNTTVLGTTDLYEGCRVQAGQCGLLEYFLMEALPALSNDGYPGAKKVRSKMLNDMISSIYNCSMSTANVEYFQKFDGVGKLLKLNNSCSERLNMIVLFALAYLIDESNNHLIMSTNETIDKIIHFLTNANNMVDRRYCGLSNVEIANALKIIAVNDENKKMIGKRNGLLPLVKMFMNAKDDSERVYSANALWMLLFDAENQSRFKEIDAAFESLLAHENSDNKMLSKAVSGIIWEMRTKHEHDEKPTSTATIQPNSKRCKHVMISYNWEQQPLMIRIRDALKSCGYNVWMDIDKIGGSTLQAMAAAVEDSAVILIAISRKYKESANCRSEAEYAFQLKKNIVPLMLEKNYQPDGWLGFVVGAKFWIDFTNRLTFNDDVVKLTKEVGERGMQVDEVIRAVDEVDLKACLPAPTRSKTDIMKDWDNEKIKELLRANNNLDKKMKKSILDKLTGTHLVSLHKLHQECPGFFFESLRGDFGFADILDLLEFTDALQKLIDDN